MFFSFGKKVKPDSWNHNKERVKNVHTATADGKFSLNNMLDNLEKECYKTYNNEIIKGVPASETLLRHLKGIVYNEEEKQSDKTLFGLIQRFINNEIKNKGKRKTDNTIKAYRTSEKRLREFENYSKALPNNKNFKLDFDTIDLDFFYKYVSFLEKNKYKQNTLAKYTQTLKVFMAEAVDLGFTNNLQFKHRKFVIDRVDTDVVYLNETELGILYKHNFSAIHPYLIMLPNFFSGLILAIKFHFPGNPMLLFALSKMLKTPTYLL